MTLRISSALALPLEFVTMTQVTLGRKGSGKTNTAVVAVEEMLASGQQIVVLDPVGVWWGLKSNRSGDGPGFPIPIIGGDHSDVQLEATAGEVIARSIVEQHFSCVIDLGLFSKGQMLRFSADFLETLYRLNRDSMHLVVDEADAFAPQRTFGEDARTLGAMQSVVRRGRARGIGVTMITQRPQVLNKDVLTQADVLCALRLSHPKDISAVKEWVDVHAEPAEAKQMVQSLPDLPTGTAWFWAPTLKLFEKVKVRQRNTFDSSATPKPGERRVEPQNLAQIDVDALGERIAATAKQQRENSADALRRKVIDLERQLESHHANSERETMLTEQIQKMEEELERSRRFIAGLAPVADGLRSLSERLTQISRDAASLSEVLGNGTIPATSEPINDVLPPAAQPKVENVVLSSPRVERSGLTSSHTKILTAMAKLHAIGVNSPGRVQVAFFSGYSNPKSGGFAGPMAKLTELGLAESSSGCVSITREGLKMVPPARPASTAELHQQLRSLLGSSEWKLLEILIKYYPEEIERTHLAAKAGYSNAKSGGFAGPLARLTSLGLARVPSPGSVSGTELLFLGR